MKDKKKSSVSSLLFPLIIFLIFFFLISSSLNVVFVSVAGMYQQQQQTQQQNGQGQENAQTQQIQPACLQNTPSQTEIGHTRCSGPPSPFGGEVAQAALSIAAHLSGMPDVFYDVLPPDVVSYSRSLCPPRSTCFVNWQSGSFQCVSFVLAAYAHANHPLPVGHNAIDFWTDYAHRSGYQRITVGTALPQPGDILVWNTPGVGHIAIVTRVVSPNNGQPGLVEYAQSNNIANIQTSPIQPDLNIPNNPLWLGSSILGFIRYTG